MRDLSEEIPKHIRKRKKKKYGLQHSSTFLNRKWVYTRWYETEKARDQAFLDIPKHTCNLLKDRGHTTYYKKVER